MQNIYEEVASLDERCYKKFLLTEDLLMEHAASGMAEYMQNHFSNETSITIVVGSGNNGADGIALARLLHPNFNVKLLYAKSPSSLMAKLQNKRALAVGVMQTNTLEDAEVIVDAIVGTGFSGTFSDEIATLLQQMNGSEAYKIACDIPSGYAFKADTTLTMGALKMSMFLDSHKDMVGKIEVINLGVTRKIYETPSKYHLLDQEDLKLPTRNMQDSHKGNYGHLAVLSGEKVGASLLAAQAALRFGAGLVSLVGHDSANTIHLPSSLMYSSTLPSNTSAIACGMGLGESFSKKELQGVFAQKIPMVLDADILSQEIMKQLIKKQDLVLTPHPKEFCALLKLLDLADITTQQLQENRFLYVELFTQKYPDITLLLKGAHVIIAHQGEFFINPHGSAKLAKGGSGDVLAGLIAALLAQGFSPLHSAIHASLAHTQLAKNYLGADFSLTPEDLIAEITKL
jgi:hydroxyethylthiazole kinase-like uncharacterized protein yjeF